MDAAGDGQRLRRKRAQMTRLASSGLLDVFFFFNMFYELIDNFSLHI
jgi:hypothetical protein